MTGNLVTDSGVDPRTVKKVVVLGLDGSSWDIIDPLVAAGDMPNMAKLLGTGVRARLRSTVPPLTAVAWPSLYTGKNPGSHGIFGFKYHDVARYPTGEQFVSSQPFAGRTWFDHLGSLGLRVCAYQTPVTYPVWPVNGSLVAGYPNPDLGKVYCHPQELAEWVPGLWPSDMSIWDSDPAQVVPAGWEALERWERTVHRFLDEDRHHFYMFVVHLTDYVVHRFWRLRDPSFPSYDHALSARLGDVIGECYRRVDTLLGRLLARSPEDCIVVLVSDHGGGRGATKRFHLNYWLRQQGLLQVARTPASRAARTAIGAMRQVLRDPKLKALAVRALMKISPSRVKRASEAGSAVDYGSSRAYAVYLYHMVWGVAINVRGRQPQGMVEPGAEYEELRDRIVAGLRDLRDPNSGSHIITQVWKREEIYQGPFLEKAPDILCYTDEDYREGWSHRELVSDLDAVQFATMSGTHRMEGILALHAPGVFSAGAGLDGAEIIDVLPTLYHAMGLPVPSDVDGKVLLEAFAPGFLADHEVRTGPAMGQTLIPGGGAYTAEEQAGIEAALRGLGYVE